MQPPRWLGTGLRAGELAVDSVAAALRVRLGMPEDRDRTSLDDEREERDEQPQVPDGASDSVPNESNGTAHRPITPEENARWQARVEEIFQSPELYSRLCRYAAGCIRNKEWEDGICLSCEPGDLAQEAGVLALGGALEWDDPPEETLQRMFSAISLVSNNWSRRSTIRARKEPEVKRQLEAREDQHEEAKHGFRIDHDVAVEMLPPQQRAAYEAMMLEDMTADEYAEQAGVSPGTAKNNLYHAGKKMRKHLEDYRPGGRSDERGGR